MVKKIKNETEKRKRKMITKRGQVTIFIIMAIVLVSLIVLFFAIPKIKQIRTTPMFEVGDYIKQCTKDGVEEAIGIMLNQAGYIQPQGYILYQGNKVGYLCYVASYYEGCINQEPVYIEHLEQDIQDFIKPRIEDCFLDLKEEYEKRNYGIKSSSLDLNIRLLPDEIKVNITKKFEISKENEKKTYNSFIYNIPSTLFDLANIAREIVNQESKYCYFDHNGYMLIYPEIDIKRMQIGAGGTASKIYIIGDKITGEKLYIAIRSCAIPPGF